MPALNGCFLKKKKKVFTHHKIQEKIRIREREKEKGKNIRQGLQKRKRYRGSEIKKVESVRKRNINKKCERERQGGREKRERKKREREGGSVREKERQRSKEGGSEKDRRKKET